MISIISHLYAKVVQRGEVAQRVEAPQQLDVDDAQPDRHMMMAMDTLTRLRIGLDDYGMKLVWLQDFVSKNEPQLTRRQSLRNTLESTLPPKFWHVDDKAMMIALFKCSELNMQFIAALKEGTNINKDELIAHIAITEVVLEQAEAFRHTYRRIMKSLDKCRANW